MIFCSSAQTPKHTSQWFEGEQSNRLWVVDARVFLQAPNKVVNIQIDDITTFPEIIRGSKVVGVKERAPNLYSRTVAWSIQLQQPHKHHAVPSQTLLHPSVWSLETREAHAKPNSYVFQPLPRLWSFSISIFVFVSHKCDLRSLITL